MNARTRRLLGAAAIMAAAATNVFAPAPAIADDPTGWIAPGGGELWIPNEFGVEPHRPMFGAIAGVALSRSLAFEARGIYAKAGFRLVHEEPYHGFGHDLVSETWEMEL